MRYQELDVIRGAAVAGMILFHINYLFVNIFGGFHSDLSDVLWYLFGKLVAIVFISVAGVSFFLFTRNKDFPHILHGAMRRFWILALLAGIISLVSYTFFPTYRISFGILHFFALVSILSLGFTRFGSWNILVGFVVIFFGYRLNSFPASSDIFAPLGLYSPEYFSADYYPIFPWFGFFLIGFGFAQFLQKKEQLHVLLSDSSFDGKLLAFIGKYSLLIYVVHVPIIYGVLRLLFG